MAPTCSSATIEVVHNHPVPRRPTDAAPNEKPQAGRRRHETDQALRQTGSEFPIKTLISLFKAPTAVKVNSLSDDANDAKQVGGSTCQRRPGGSWPGASDLETSVDDT